MTAPDLPASVPFVRVEAALARFGIPLDHLVELRIDRHGLTATRYRLDRNGRPQTIYRYDRDGHGAITGTSEFATTDQHIPFDRGDHR